MQQTDKLNALTLDTVDHDKRGAAYHQLAGALLAASAPHFRVRNQLTYLLLDPVTLFDGRLCALLGDAAKLRVTVRNRPG